MTHLLRNCRKKPYLNSETGSGKSLGLAASPDAMELTSGLPFLAKFWPFMDAVVAVRAAEEDPTIFTQARIFAGFHLFLFRCSFPTCQVRVVRFYVSLFSFSSSSPPPPLLLFRLVVYLLRPCDVPDLNRDPVSSVWRAGPQPRSCEFSVASRTSTAIP